MYHITSSGACIEARVCTCLPRNFTPSLLWGTLPQAIVAIESAWLEHIQNDDIVAPFAEQKQRRLNFEMIINLKCSLCINKTCLNCKTINRFIKLFYIQYIKFRKSHLRCKITQLEINTFYHWVLGAVAAPGGGDRGNVLPPPQHNF